MAILKPSSQAQIQNALYFEINAGILYIIVGCTAPKIVKSSHVSFNWDLSYWEFSDISGDEATPENHGM